MRNKGLVLLAMMQDKNDRSAFKDALASVRINASISFVKRETQLLDILNGVGKYVNRVLYPIPNIILLVAELTDESTMALLAQLKAFPEAKRIPIVVVSRLYTSTQLKKAYQLGVTSVIKHPARFETMVELIKVIDDYWFNTVSLPKT